MARKIEVNIGNRTFYTLIAILSIALIAGIVYALNSGNPAIHGHTSDEIQGTIEEAKSGTVSLTISSSSCTEIKSVDFTTSGFSDFSNSNYTILLTPEESSLSTQCPIIGGSPYCAMYLPYIKSGTKTPEGFLVGACDLEMLPYTGTVKIEWLAFKI